MAPSQALVRAKKTAGKRKVDEVATDEAESTVDTPSRKRRRTQSPKYVEPETVEDEVEPTVMPVAVPNKAKKLSAKQKRQQARELAPNAQ